MIEGRPSSGQALARRVATPSVLIADAALGGAPGVVAARLRGNTVADLRPQADCTSLEMLSGRLREEVSRAARHCLPLTLLMFRVQAAREGGQCIDDLTRTAVRLTRGVVRRSDVVGLLGSGEFGVVANATLEGAGVLAELLVRQLQAFGFTCADGPVPVQMRYALSCLSDRKTADDLLAEARAALQPSASPHV